MLFTIKGLFAAFIAVVSSNGTSSQQDAEFSHGISQGSTAEQRASEMVPTDERAPYRCNSQELCPSSQICCDNECVRKKKCDE